MKATHEKLMVEVDKTRERLEAAQNASREIASRSRVLTSILSAQKEGKLTGVLGRLGDLGSID